EGGFRLRPQEKAHAGVEDQPLPGDAGGFERRNPRLEEGTYVLDDIALRRRPPVRIALPLDRMHDDEARFALGQLRIEALLREPLDIVEPGGPLSKRESLRLTPETVDGKRNTLARQRLHDRGQAADLFFRRNRRGIGVR